MEVPVEPALGHARGIEFYAGGSGAVLEQILAPSIIWTVPGENNIAGTYRGLESRVGEGNRLAALVDGSATIGGVAHRWSTVGLYDVAQEQIAACWLLPLDQREFDAIWTV